MEGHFGKENIWNNNNNHNAGRGRSARKSADSQHSSPRCSPAQLRRSLYLKVFRELVRERGPEYIRKAKQESKASKASKQSKQAKQASKVRERGPKPSKLSKLSKPRRLHYLKSSPGAAKFPPQKYFGNLSLI